MSKLSTGTVFDWAEKNGFKEKDIFLLLKITKSLSGIRSASKANDKRLSVINAAQKVWPVIHGMTKKEYDNGQNFAKMIIAEAYKDEIFATLNGKEATSSSVYNYVSAKNKIVEVADDFGIDIHEFIDIFCGSSESMPAFSMERLKFMAKAEVLELPVGEPETRHKTLQEIVETYGLDAVEFANADAETHKKSIEFIGEALENLAEVLNLKDDDRKKIGFQGKLTLRVGLAAGDFSGLCGSTETGVTIELGGKTGWSALSHEWWHACDNQLFQELKKRGEIKDSDSWHLSDYIFNNKDADGSNNQAIVALKNVLKTFDAPSVECVRHWEEERSSLKLNYFDRFILPRVDADKKESVNIKLNEWLNGLSDSSVLEREVAGLKEVFKGSGIELGRYLTYVETELEFAIERSKDLKMENATSLFKTFARSADVNIDGKVETITGPGYTESVVEMSARSFESAFVASNFKSSGRVASAALSNYNNGNRLYPLGDERRAQQDAWNVAVPILMKALPSVDRKLSSGFEFCPSGKAASAKTSHEARPAVEKQQIKKKV